MAELKRRRTAWVRDVLVEVHDGAELDRAEVGRRRWSVSTTATCGPLSVTLDTTIGLRQPRVPAERLLATGERHPCRLTLARMRDARVNASWSVASNCCALPILAAALASSVLDEQLPARGRMIFTLAHLPGRAPASPLSAWTARWPPWLSVRGGTGANLNQVLEVPYRAGPDLFPSASRWQYVVTNSGIVWSIRR